MEKILILVIVIAEVQLLNRIRYTNYSVVLILAPFLPVIVSIETRN